MPTIREVPRLCELVFFLDGVLAEPLPSPLCIPSLWWAQEGFGGVSRQMCYGHRGVVLPMKGASPGRTALGASVKDSGYIASLFIWQTFPATLLCVSLCWEKVQTELFRASPRSRGEPGKRGCAAVRTRPAQGWARCFRGRFLGPPTPDDPLGGNDVLTSAHIRVFFNPLFVLRLRY